MILSIFFPFALLFTIQLVSETLVQSLRIPIPGAVVGALVLFGLLLRFKGLHQKIAHGSHALIKNMLVLYVPISVGLMDRATELRENGAMLLTVLVFSTTVTALTTAWVFERAIKPEVDQ
jgi:holin-like protein